MSDNPAHAYASVRSLLAAHPKIDEVFVRMHRALSRRADLSLLVSGSLASGRVDELSDIDLEVVAHPGADLSAIRATADEALRSLGRPVAHFPATHLGLRDLHVFFLDRDGSVVKLDMWIAGLDALSNLSEGRLVHDPAGVIAAIRAASSPQTPSIDYDDLHHKFCGWMWFTMVKIRRSHLFEAVESIDFMRGFALMPFLHLLSSSPPHGYRHLEDRLPAFLLGALASTFARAHERFEVLRAFWALVELFQSVQPDVETKLGRPLQGADLARMTERVKSIEPAD